MASHPSRSRSTSRLIEMVAMEVNTSMIPMPRIRGCTMILTVLVGRPTIRITNGVTATKIPPIQTISWGRQEAPEHQPPTMLRYIHPRLRWFIFLQLQLIHLQLPQLSLRDRSLQLLLELTTIPLHLQCTWYRLGTMVRQVIQTRRLQTLNVILPMTLGSPLAVCIIILMPRWHLMHFQLILLKAILW